MHPSRPILRRRLRPVWRAVETSCVAVLLITSVLYAGSRVAGTDLTVSAVDSPAVTRTLGELLGDLLTGRGSWTPTATWTAVVVLIAVAACVTAAVSVRRRRRISAAGRRCAQRRSPLGAGVGR